MNISEVLKDKRKCSGCTACYNSCKLLAITMQEDMEGFQYPAINLDKCVNCGQCVEACPIYEDTMPRHSTVQKAYAAINKDPEIRKRSSSGGAFYALASAILKQEGVVYGAAFVDHYRVEHIRVDHFEELNRLQGSKYVQSLMKSTMQDVRKDLLAGRQVLFSGTPCEVGGLISFLGKPYPNLTTVDFICHGVPSPKVWNRYIDEKDRSMGGIESVFFRDETYSWEKFALNIQSVLGRSSYCKDTDHDPYLKGFLLNLYLRPSCGLCHFKDKYRLSDFTIADFWGIKNVLPDLYDGHGISVVLLHTQHARTLFDEIDGLTLTPVDYDEAILHNFSMQNSSLPHPKRHEFFCDLDQSAESINTLLHKYTRERLLKRIFKLMIKIYRKIR